MAQVDNPILNSPFAAPARHWQLDDEGTPTGVEVAGRRPSAYVVPIPKPKKKKASQAELALEGGGDAGGAKVTPNDFINEVRGQVDRWRALPPSQWGVTHETARLLQHWRSGAPTPPLFFCQLEAVETLIWLAEVARKEVRDRLKTFNEEANPGLFRVACKMATGAGKTTVMAMLIAWQCVNAVRHRGARFSDAFLIVCPGITIRDRLRVLLPSDPDTYYQTRGLVPDDMLQDVRKARIVITNYHALKPRETLKVPKFSRQLLEGRSGEVRASSVDDVACWFVDTDYDGESFFVRQAYFLGGNDPYQKLKTTLKAEIDEDAWASLYSAESRLFPKPATGRIAVKVINHYGDEVLKVFGV